MIFASDVYAKGGYPMPDRDSKDITPKEKDSKEYNIAMAKAIYSLFCGGRTYAGRDIYNTVDEYRAYAYGQQDSERYKDAFYGKSQNGVISPLGGDEERTLRRKAFSNLNFTVMSPMPRVMDALVGKISKATDLVSVDPMDEYSTNLKDDIKWGTYVDGKFRELFQSLRAIGGLPQEELGYVPRNVDELNLYEAEGGFKLSYADAMEQLVKFTLDVSRWDEEIQDRVIFDLVVNGFAAVEDIYDESTGLTRVQYLDAKYTGVQYNRNGGYSNPDYGFTATLEKVSDLRLKGYSEDDLKGLAKKFSDMFGNPASDDWSESNKTGNTYYRPYDEYLVPVFKVYWIDVDYETEVEYTNKYGSRRTFEYKEGYKPTKKEKLITSRIKTLRQVHWIIDTEHAYDYGRAKHQPRDGYSHPVVPIHMVKVLGRPILPRLIPALDLYMNSWMKFQQGIRMAALNGFTIEMGAISNLSLGNKKLNPLDIIKMWRETGILFRKDTDVVGRMNVASRAIEPLAGGAGAMLKEALDGMQVCINIIEQVTGINPITLGQTPTADQGKGLTEYAMGATDVILNGVIKQVNILKQDAARNICLRLQCTIRNEKLARKVYGNIIGDTRLELLKQAEGHDVRYGIRTVVRPTQEEVNYLKEMIAMSLKNGRDGKVGIGEAEAVRFIAMINSGQSLKRVSLLLDFANQKANEAAQARQAEMVQIQSQEVKSQQQTATQLKAMEYQNEAQAKIAVENTKARNEMLMKAYEKGDLSYADLERLLGISQQQPQPQEGNNMV